MAAVTDLTPSLGPFNSSHSFDGLEDEIKQMMIEIFRATLRDDERKLNAFATPHLADISVVEMWILADGIGALRGGFSDNLRYIFKAWRSRNPKRGLHFLRTYLQMIWPNGWAASQMWQKKDLAYPTSLFAPVNSAEVAAIANTHFLTSRVNVSVISDQETGSGVASVAKSIRAALGAKYVVYLNTARTSKMTANAAGIGTQFHLLSGSGTLK